MNPIRISLILSGLLHTAVAIPIFIGYLANTAKQTPLETQEIQRVLSVSITAAVPESVLQAKPKPTRKAQPKPKPKPAPKPETQSILEPATPEPEPMPVQDKPETDAAVPETGERDYKQAPNPHQDQATPELSAINVIQLLEQAYLSALIQAIEAQKYYPSRARRRTQEGEVLVGFTINREGRIQDIRILQSSSVRSLDRAAITAVKRLGQFQPIPEDIDRNWWNLEIRLNYQLL